MPTGWSRSLRRTGPTRAAPQQGLLQCQFTQFGRKPRLAVLTQGLRGGCRKRQRTAGYTSYIVIKGSLWSRSAARASRLSNVAIIMTPAITMRPTPRQASELRGASPAQSHTRVDESSTNRMRSQVAQISPKARETQPHNQARQYRAHTEEPCKPHPCQTLFDCLAPAALLHRSRLAQTGSLPCKGRGRDGIRIP